LTRCDGEHDRALTEILVRAKYVRVDRSAAINTCVLAAGAAAAAVVGRARCSDRPPLVGLFSPDSVACGFCSRAAALLGEDPNHDTDRGQHAATPAYSGPALRWASVIAMACRHGWASALHEIIDRDVEAARRESFPERRSATPPALILSNSWIISCIVGSDARGASTALEDDGLQARRHVLRHGHQRAMATGLCTCAASGCPEVVGIEGKRPLASSYKITPNE